MPTVVISILADGMPVDQMQDDDEGNTCPLPTQDEKLNTTNLEIAVAEHDYCEAKGEQACGNCGMFNQSDDMLECMDDDSGETGYCQLLKFMCNKEYTCNEWVEGGPITSDSQEEYKDIL